MDQCFCDAVQCFSGAAVCTVGWVSLSGGRGEGRWKAAAHCSQLPQLHSAQADWLHKRQHKWVGEAGCTLQTDIHRTQTALPSPHSRIMNLRRGGLSNRTHCPIGVKTPISHSEGYPSSNICLSQGNWYSQHCASWKTTDRCRFAVFHFWNVISDVPKLKSEHESIFGKPSKGFEILQHFYSKFRDAGS